jgi:estrogen-related receptor beta like 1
MESKEVKQQVNEEDLDALNLMDDILDKLKVLNYEKHFLKQKINKPLSRSYFALKSVNPGDQFIYFSSLSFWLLSLLGSNIQGDKIYDDPNTASQNIIIEAKKVGVDLNVPINKLRTGYGDYVCYVLINLINKALEKQGTGFKKMKNDTTKDPNLDTNYVEIEEDDPDKLNQEIDFGDNIKGNKAENIDNNKDQQEESSILKSDIPKKAWLREVEKVSSKLKFDYDESNSNSYTSEWRNHLSLIKSSDKKLIQSVPQSRAVLENLSEDIGNVLDKIQQKETMVSKNFTQIISEYKSRQVDANNQIDEFNVLRSNCDKLQKEFEEYEEKENELTDKYNKANSNLTNTSQTTNIKQGILKLTQDSLSFDMKIAILNNSINSFRQRGINTLQINSIINEIPDGSLWDETK